MKLIHHIYKEAMFCLIVWRQSLTKSSNYEKKRSNIFDVDATFAKFKEVRNKEINETAESPNIKEVAVLKYTHR